MEHGDTKQQDEYLHIATVDSIQQSDIFSDLSENRGFKQALTLMHRRFAM